MNSRYACCIEVTYYEIKTGCDVILHWYQVEIFRIDNFFKNLYIHQIGSSVIVFRAKVCYAISPGVVKRHARTRPSQRPLCPPAINEYLASSQLDRDWPSNPFMLWLRMASLQHGVPKAFFEYGTYLSFHIRLFL